MNWRKNNRLFDAFLLPGLSSCASGDYHRNTTLRLHRPAATQSTCPATGIERTDQRQARGEDPERLPFAYFDQGLKGMPSPLPFGPLKEYPDLRWEN